MESKPIGRFLMPAGVADAVLFLASLPGGAVSAADVGIDNGYVQDHVRRRENDDRERT